MALVNTMEGLIDDKLRMMLEGETCCKCERCFEDMKAIALNSLPSKYVNTHNGELFFFFFAGIIQNSADITIAISKAIRKVADHPSHDKPQS